MNWQSIPKQHRYRSTKSYGHEVGLSAVFRQHGATSHCRFLHGYALAVRFEFEAAELDSNGWVIDFGALKPLKTMLEQTFDHKLLVAKDDPALPNLFALAVHNLVEIVVVERTGCEAFARMIYEATMAWLLLNHPRVHLVSVEVSEHGANSAIYSRSEA